MTPGIAALAKEEKDAIFWRVCIFSSKKQKQDPSIPSDISEFTRDD